MMRQVKERNVAIAQESSAVTQTREDLAQILMALRVYLRQAAARGSVRPESWKDLYFPDIHQLPGN